MYDTLNEIIRKNEYNIKAAHPGEVCRSVYKKTYSNKELFRIKNAV